ncbi:MAG: TetR/AcrR family transcriptional regulator [Lachnospiraceae bacterium]
MKQEEKTKLTREKIISAAMEEFGINGYAGTALNSIVSRAGIAKGLFYHNFQSKDEIYILCIGRSMQQLTEYLRQQDIGADLKKYTRARLDFFKSHPNASRLFFEAVLQPPVALREQIAKQRKEFDALNLEIYDRILEKLSLREGVTKEEASSYFKLMQEVFNGYFSSPAFGEMPLFDKIEAHEAYLPKVMEMMLYGIAEKRNEQ